MHIQYEAVLTAMSALLNMNQVQIAIDRLKTWNGDGTIESVVDLLQDYQVNRALIIQECLDALSDSEVQDIEHFTEWAELDDAGVDRMGFDIGANSRRELEAIKSANQHYSKRQ